MHHIGSFGLSSTCLRRFINCLNYRWIDCTWLIIHIAAMPCLVFPCIEEEPFIILLHSCLMFFFPFLSRSKTSQRLISHDIHSNTYNYKSTFSVEIVPVCKVHSSRLIISVGLEFHTALYFYFFFKPLLSVSFWLPGQRSVPFTSAGAKSGEHGSSVRVCPSDEHHPPHWPHNPAEWVGFPPSHCF